MGSIVRKSDFVRVVSSWTNLGLQRRRPAEQEMIRVVATVDNGLVVSGSVEVQREA